MTIRTTVSLRPSIALRKVAPDFFSFWGGSSFFFPWIGRWEVWRPGLSSFYRDQKIAW